MKTRFEVGHWRVSLQYQTLTVLKNSNNQYSTRLTIVTTMMMIITTIMIMSEDPQTAIFGKLGLTITKLILLGIFLIVETWMVMM